MKTSFNKSVSRISYSACWLAIIFISLILIDSSISPWKKTYLGIELPKIDPLVHLSNRFSFPLNPEYLNKKEKKDNPDFYSGILANSYVEVFYRPDFKGYPTYTLLILFFRLAAYICLVLFFFLLSQILKSVYKGSPFNSHNYRRLLFMGLLIIFISIVRVFHSCVMADFLSKNPKLLGWNIVGSYQALWLIPFGLLLVILSYVFKEQVRIHEELKLTV